MKLIINLVLFALVVLLAFMLVKTIQDPVLFKEEYTARKDAVVEKLIMNRTAQELHREITGEYASSYEQLKQGLTTGNFKIIAVLGDPDDPDNPTPITYDTLLVPAADSVPNVIPIPIEQLADVPYGNGAKFEIWADTVTYQRTVVHVCEVSTTYDKFMGEFADPKYKKYDNRYDPKGVLKFGDRQKPALSGNWE